MIFGAGSCEDPVDADSNYNRQMIPNYKTIKPMSIGAGRTYERTIFDSDGNVVDSFYDFCRIKKDTIIDGLRWFSGDEPGVDWQTNKSDGLHYREYDSLGGFVEWIEAKYPTQVGFSWVSMRSTRTVVSIDTAISIGSRSFECVMYKEINPNNEGELFYIFYGVGIGKIKSETYREAEKKTYLKEQIELKSYDL